MMGIQCANGRWFPGEFKTRQGFFLYWKRRSDDHDGDFASKGSLFLCFRQHAH